MIGQAFLCEKALHVGGLPPTIVAFLDNMAGQAVNGIISAFGH